MRLLVVEDEKDMNKILVKELESEGYLVDSCYDGESAFDYLCMAEYDGAILDPFSTLKIVNKAEIPCKIR